MELKENLSKNLILLRGPKSQAVFSEKLGVTKSTIQAIEAQKSAVRLDTLDIIARNLGLPAPALKYRQSRKVIKGGGYHVVHITDPAYRRIRISTFYNWIAEHILVHDSTFLSFTLLLHRQSFRRSDISALLQTRSESAHWRSWPHTSDNSTGSCMHLPSY